MRLARKSHKKRRRSVTTQQYSEEDFLTDGLDAASDAVTVTTASTPVHTDSGLENLQRLKLLAVELREKLARIQEVKDPDALYKLLVEFLREDPTNLDALVKFYTVQRCTSRKLIREVVMRLTLEESRKALALLCDVSLLVGIGLVPVESQFRQAWVMELFRRVSQNELREPKFRQELLRSCQRKADGVIVSYHAMGKLYGRLTTVLDHQYRMQLKQQNDVSCPVASAALSTVPPPSNKHELSSLVSASVLNLNRDYEGGNSSSDAEDQSTDDSRYSSDHDDEPVSDNATYSD